MTFSITFISYTLPLELNLVDLCVLCPIFIYVQYLGFSKLHHIVSYVLNLYIEFVLVKS